MGTVNVRVGHDDDAIVASLGNVLVEADPAADGLDHAHDFFVCEHFIFTALVSVNDLASQRQDGLSIPESATLGAPTCRITFHKVEFALFHFVADAVAEFAWQATSA